MDRKQEFFDNNMSICEYNCDFIAYNYETQKAVCSCNIKTEMPFMDNIKFDKDVLMNSFTDIKNIANLKMMKCYKTIFRKETIIKNFGCFIYAVLIILDFICLILFLTKDFGKLKKEIEKIKNINDMNKGNDINFFSKIKRKSFNNVKKTQIKNEKDKSSQRKIKLNNNNLFEGKNQNIKIENKKNVKNNSKHPKAKAFLLKDNNDIRQIDIRKKSIINMNNKHHHGNKNKKINDNKNKRNSLNIPELNSNRIRNKKKKLVKKQLQVNLNCSEFNSLKYEEAIIYDKRTYSQYYSSLLKTKHIILYIFYTEDYNSRMIKISLFIFNLATYMAINALFFNDTTMHKIYIDHGSYNFVYQLPKMIYSFLISTVLNILIKSLGLSESNVLKFKKEKVNIINKFYELITLLKIKFIIFYICSFSSLALFWFYISCFCGIYKNTQIHLIKDSLFSFALSLATPFAINLLPGIFRKLGIKKKNKCLYGFSKVLQIF